PEQAVWNIKPVHFKLRAAPSVTAQSEPGCADVSRCSGTMDAGSQTPDKRDAIRACLDIEAEIPHCLSNDRLRGEYCFRVSGGGTRRATLLRRDGQPGQAGRLLDLHHRPGLILRRRRQNVGEADHKKPQGHLDDRPFVIQQHAKQSTRIDFVVGMNLNPGTTDGFHWRLSKGKLEHANGCSGSLLPKFDQLNDNVDTRFTIDVLSLISATSARRANGASAKKCGPGRRLTISTSGLAPRGHHPLPGVIAAGTCCAFATHRHAQSPACKP